MDAKGKDRSHLMRSVFLSILSSPKILTYKIDITKVEDIPEEFRVWINRSDPGGILGRKYLLGFFELKQDFFEGKIVFAEVRG